MKKDFDEYGFFGLFYHAENLSEYSDKEFNALYQNLPMNQEIFDRCIKTAFSIYDFKNIKYLIKKYPEFAKNNSFLEKFHFI